MLSELDKKYLRNKLINTIEKKKVLSCFYNIYGEVITHPLEKNCNLISQKNIFLIKDKIEGKNTPYLYVIIKASTNVQKFYYEYELFSFKKYMKESMDTKIASQILENTWKYLINNFKKNVKNNLDSYM